MKRYIKFFHIMLICLFCLSVHNAFPAEPGMVVSVAVPPMKYFVEKIGGPGLSVNVMVPPGADAHTYEPKPSTMMALSRSRLYISVGLPLERTWLGRFGKTARNLTIVQADAGVVKIAMRHRHNGGSGHEADEHGMDPHIWLSPSCVRHMADTIRDAFITMDPTHRENYLRNHRSFTAEIDALDADMKKTFVSTRSKSRFLVFHPAWGYFARDYGLEQIPIEIEGKEPKPADIIRISRDAKKNGIRVVFSQPRASSRGAHVIADAIGGRVVEVDPLAENWTANLRKVAAEFKEAMK